MPIMISFYQGPFDEILLFRMFEEIEVLGGRIPTHSTNPSAPGYASYIVGLR